MRSRRGRWFCRQPEGALLLFHPLEDTASSHPARGMRTLPNTRSAVDGPDRPANSLLVDCDKFLWFITSSLRYFISNTLRQHIPPLTKP